jgi:hypothetical protein
MAHGGANPRFVVASLNKAACDARRLCEDIYCTRGEMESRIKECQLDQPARQAPAPSPQAPMSARHRRGADPTSARTMRANQLRIWLASLAGARPRAGPWPDPGVLLCALRRIGLRHTQLAEATCGTIRLRLLKIGALVRTSCRRIMLARDGLAVLPSGGSADGRWSPPSPASRNMRWPIST